MLSPPAASLLPSSAAKPDGWKCTAVLKVQAGTQGDLRLPRVLQGDFHIVVYPEDNASMTEEILCISGLEERSGWGLCSETSLTREANEE